MKPNRSEEWLTSWQDIGGGNRMENGTKWAVLISIKAHHAANIYAGTKKMELRKTVPRYEPAGGAFAKYPLRVYMYESKTGGGAGAITGFFDCQGFIGTSGSYMQSMADAAQVSMEALCKYGNGGWVFGWKVEKPGHLSQPVPLAEIGMDMPLQSWCYLKADACAILEERTPRYLRP